MAVVPPLCCKMPLARNTLVVAPCPSASCNKSQSLWLLVGWGSLCHGWGCGATSAVAGVCIVETLWSWGVGQ